VAINLNDPNLAVSAFAMARKLISPEDDQWDITLGEATAQWLQGARDTAVDSCLRLFHMDLAYALSDLKLDDSRESKILKEVIAETLRRHPTGTN
jgi:hypothetical protein